MNLATYQVAYTLGSYSGRVTVHADPDAEDVEIVAIAKRELYRRAGGAPTGLYYESWKVVRP